MPRVGSLRARPPRCAASPAVQHVPDTPIRAWGSDLLEQQVGFGWIPSCPRAGSCSVCVGAQPQASMQGESRAHFPGPVPIVPAPTSFLSAGKARWMQAVSAAQLAWVRAVPLGVLGWGGSATQWARSVPYGGTSQAPGGCPLTLVFPKGMVATPGCSDGCDPQGSASSQSNLPPARAPCLGHCSTCLPATGTQA